MTLLGMEEAPYDSASMRRFAGVDLGDAPAPDKSTICRFRDLLEEPNSGVKLFQQVHRHLEVQGINVGSGTIVDATIIAAPPSTKNKDKQRDPDMHQTKKGNQWHFGMKEHIGVDSQSKRIQLLKRVFWVCEDVLPGLGEERTSVVRELRAGQSVPDAQAAVAPLGGIVCPQCAEAGV